MRRRVVCRTLTRRLLICHHQSVLRVDMESGVVAFTKRAADTRHLESQTQTKSKAIASRDPSDTCLISVLTLPLL